MDITLNQALFDKAKTLDVKGIKTLLDQGADIEALSEFEENLLSTVVQKENAKECIVFLLDNEFDINSQDHYASSTALIIASAHSMIDNVEVLLKEGADPDLVNSDGQTALNQAVATGCLENIQLLLSYGADVNELVRGVSPLMVAVENGERAEGKIILNFLLNQGADINAEDGYGTALWSAIAEENLEIVKLLIGKGAKIEGIKSIHNNETTLEFAERVGNNAIIEYLRSQFT